MNSSYSRLTYPGASGITEMHQDAWFYVEAGVEPRALYMLSLSQDLTQPPRLLYLALQARQSLELYVPSIWDYHLVSHPTNLPSQVQTSSLWFRSYNCLCLIHMSVLPLTLGRGTLDRSGYLLLHTPRLGSSEG